MSVAKTYARALYESIQSPAATSTVDTFERLQKELQDFQELMASSEPLRKALVAPVTSAAEKAGLVSDLSKKAGYSEIFSRFLALLARKGRLDAFIEIREAFDEVRLEAEGGILGRLVTADPADPADVDALAKAFTKKLGKRVAFRVSTDPSLLAGMRVVVNGVTYDGSLSAQLRQLRDRFVYGSNEVH